MRFEITLAGLSGFFWDGLIINAAHSSGAEILYTEDLNHGQILGGVRVVSPFKS